MGQFLFLDFPVYWDCGEGDDRGTKTLPHTLGALRPNLHWLGSLRRACPWVEIGTKRKQWIVPLEWLWIQCYVASSKKATPRIVLPRCLLQSLFQVLAGHTQCVPQAPGISEWPSLAFRVSVHAYFGRFFVGWRLPVSAGGPSGASLSSTFEVDFVRDALRIAPMRSMLSLDALLFDRSEPPPGGVSSRRPGVVLLSSPCHATCA